MRGLQTNLARPRTVAPPGAPTRPDRGMSGFWIRQVLSNLSVGLWGLVDSKILERPEAPAASREALVAVRRESFLPDILR